MFTMQEARALVTTSKILNYHTKDSLKQNYESALFKIKAILFIVIALLLSNVSTAQTQKRMTTKQITIREKKVEINYFQQGRGDTTILFLHGWCIDGMYWKDQVDYFSKNYNVFAIDLPGFGKSKAERTNWTIEEYANDVTAFIETMNLKNVVIIGHSMAGEIMLQTALTNSPKIAGIVGVDNFKMIDVSFSPEQMKQMTDFFPLLEKDFKNSAPVYADLMLFHPATSKEVRERVKSDFANSNSVVGFGTMMNQMQYAYTDPQRLEKLNYKLYLINSDGFPTNETGLKNHCKSSFQVETISATGHYPMIEKPAEFNLILEKVLTGMK
jgi:pimeloyl-ACP methyl ester carboxylesterase